jgi:hypothetical protein
MQFDYTRPASAPEIFPGVPFVPITLYHAGIFVFYSLFGVFLLDMVNTAQDNPV